MPGGSRAVFGAEGLLLQKVFAFRSLPFLPPPPHLSGRRIRGQRPWRCLPGGSIPSPKGSNALDTTKSITNSNNLFLFSSLFFSLSPAIYGTSITFFFKNKAFLVEGLSLQSKAVAVLLQHRFFFMLFSLLYRMR
jgi:hypothetical protein